MFTEEVITDFTPKEADQFEYLMPNRAEPPLGTIMADEVVTLLRCVDRDMDVFALEGAHLPYPTTWIEGHEPDGSGTTGMMLTQFRGTFQSEYHEGFQATIFFTRPRCVVVLEPYILQLEMRNGRLSNFRYRPGSTIPEPPSNARLFSHAGFVLFALGMVNARNVQIEHVVPQPKISRKFERKHDRPLVRYGKIILPAKTRAAVDIVQARKAAGETLPLHLRRGHTKTYTEERPLFGQHVGEFFWDWAVVGDPRAGINVNTYEVRPPDEPPASNAG